MPAQRERSISDKTSAARDRNHGTILGGLQKVVDDARHARHRLFETPKVISFARTKRIRADRVDRGVIVTLREL